MKNNKFLGLEYNFFKRSIINLLKNFCMKNYILNLKSYSKNFYIF